MLINKIQLEMKHQYFNGLKILLPIIVIILFTSCERISFDEYALSEYDGELTWERITKKADWSKRYDHDAVVFNDKIWVMGGYNPGVMNGDTYFEDVWCSSDGKNWDLVVEDAPWLGRRGHELAVLGEGDNQALLLVGGFSADEETGYRQYNNDVWKTTDGKNWEIVKETTQPTESDNSDWIPRMHHKIVNVNRDGTEYLYLIGGQSMAESGSSAYGMNYYNDVWRSVDGINWERVMNNDYGIRSEHAVAVNPEGKIFVHGGMHGVVFESENNEEHPLPNWQYLWSTEDGINWTAEINEDLIPGDYYWRAAHEMVFYEEKLWVLPGKTTSNVHYTFTNSNQYPIWTYSDYGNWNVDSEGTAIDARHSYSVVIFGDKIWILGGFTNANGQANDVWTAKL